jgi:hypothetical protein
MAATIQVTFDCADPARLAAFWATTLGYQLQAPPPGYDSWDAFLEAHGVPPEARNDKSAVVDPAGAGPRLFFQRVPEGKAGKNRVHLDVTVSGGLGASPEERRRDVDDAILTEAERGCGPGSPVRASVGVP